MARVLLFEPGLISSGSNQDMNPHGGLLMLGTVLKNAGHQVKVVHFLTDCRGFWGEYNFILENFKPDVVGITFTTFQLKAAKEAAALVKSLNPRIITVAGGAHVSATSGLQDYFDYLVKGEGEITFQEIIEGKVKGMKYLSGKPIAGLDSLPYPDLSLIDINKFAGIYPYGPLPQLNVMYSRGCPFQCSFCSKSVFGPVVRYRSPEHVIEEIEKAVKDFGVKEVFFQDDTFNVNREYCEKLLSAIISRGLNKKVKFRARLRANVNLLDNQLLRNMKAANFWLIFYGCENGNQAMLNSMSKGLKVDEIRRAFQLTREAGLKAEASFIIGMPGETVLSINQSIELAHDIRPYWNTFNKAIPFPGTRFEELVRSRGNLLYLNYEDWQPDNMLVRTDSLLASELEYWWQVANRSATWTRMKALLSHPVKICKLIKNKFVEEVAG